MKVLYRNRAKHSLVVEVVGRIEVRIAETKWDCVHYTQEGKSYARKVKEFDRKFERVEVNAND